MGGRVDKPQAIHRSARHGSLRHPILAALFSALAACGGGDDGSSRPSAGNVTTAPAGAQGGASPTTAVAASTYPQGSEELAAFNFLNGERGRCGFGQLAQNASLDAAAKAHADYQLVNNFFSHTEDRVNFPSGFTGTTMTDRFAVQGYTNWGGAVDEISGITGIADKAGFGVNGMRNLLNAPYHLKGMMSGMRDAGVAVRSSQDTGTSTPRVILQWDGAYLRSAGPQTLGAADVLTYPCEGSTGVNRLLANESPEPVPGRNLLAEPLGTSVYVAARAGNTLVVSTVAMTNAGNGNPVTLRGVVTAANDPQREYGRGEAYVAADAPLEPNTAYQVNVSGTNNGAAFTRTFTFTTGP
jgi:uncharacterized protein YkwD